MKIWVTGAAGMLGSVVYQTLSNYGFEIIGTAHNTQALTYLDSIDISDQKQVEKFIDKHQPNCIVHCAAIVDLNLCQSNPNLAMKVNASSVKYLCAQGKTKLIYISTDSVFDGKKGNYSENDPVNPLNVYAKSKLIGEGYALSFEGNVVLRTNIYGQNHLPKNSLLEWAKRELLQGNTITGFDDVYFNPLSTYQLANLILDSITATQVNGVFHAGAQDQLSKYAFLLKLCVKWGVSTDYIKKGSIFDFPSQVARPVNTTLNCEKLQSKFGKTARIDDGLKFF